MNNDETIEEGIDDIEQGIKKNELCCHICSEDCTRPSPCLCKNLIICAKCQYIMIYDYDTEFCTVCKKTYPEDSITSEEMEEILTKREETVELSPERITIMVRDESLSHRECITFLDIYILLLLSCIIVGAIIIVKNGDVSVGLMFAFQILFGMSCLCHMIQRHRDRRMRPSGGIFTRHLL